VWASYGSTAAAADTDSDLDNSSPATASIDVPATGFCLTATLANGTTWTFTGVTEDAATSVEGWGIAGASESFGAAQTGLAITATPGAGTTRVLVAASFV